MEGVHKDELVQKWAAAAQHWARHNATVDAASLCSDFINDYVDHQRRIAARWLTVAEAAEVGAVSERTVRRWINQQVIVSERHGGRRVVLSGSIPLPSSPIVATAASRYDAEADARRLSRRSH